MSYCRECDENHFTKCEQHNMGSEYRKQRIEINRYFDQARKLLGLRNEEVPLVKGLRGTSSKDHSCEHLGKGLLRAKYGLNVNKDGTIRYDMTEMVVTHFEIVKII